MRLDLEETLNWPIPKDYVEDFSADFGQYKDTGRRIRASDAYFAPGETMIGLNRLRTNILQSAFYTRTIAANARNIVFVLISILLCIFIVFLVTGAYRRLFQGPNAAGEFVVAALLLLVTRDLFPLGLQYNTLHCAAAKTRVMLSTLSASAADTTVMPIIIEYQLARAMAPLLPTYSFMKRRSPLGAIWSAEDDSDRTR